MEKFENHFPDSVTAETYTNGDGTPPMYVAGQASYSGREEPSFTYTMMMKDQRNCNILLMCKEQELDIGVTVAENFMRIEFAKDPVSAALEISMEQGEYLKDIIRFYLNSEEPLTVTELTVDQNGERTLPTEPGDRTVLAIEDDLSGESGKVLRGFTMVDDTGDETWTYLEITGFGFGYQWRFATDIYRDDADPQRWEATAVMNNDTDNVPVMTTKLSSVSVSQQPSPIFDGAVIVDATDGLDDAERELLGLT